MGAAGPVIIFVMGSIGAGLIGAWTFLYASHCLLVVVEQTAAGIRRVRWPDEPFLDWCGRGFYMLVILAISFVPSIILGTLIGGGFSSKLWIIPATIAMLWVIFPIILLSIMAAESLTGVVNPDLWGRLLYHFLPLFIFYVASALLVAAAGISLYMALSGPNIPLVFLSPWILSAALLIYGRLLGRVAWAVGHREPEFRRKAEKDEVKVDPNYRSQAVDPWAMPPNEEDELDELDDGDIDREEPAEEDEFASKKEPYSFQNDDDAADFLVNGKDSRNNIFEFEDSEAPLPLTVPIEGNSTTLPPDMSEFQKKTDRKSANKYGGQHSRRDDDWEDEEDELEYDDDDHEKEDWDDDDHGPHDDDDHEEHPQSQKKNKPMRRPKPKRHPVPMMFIGVYEFPWYPTSLGAWISLSILFTVLSLFAIMIAWAYQSSGLG